MKVAPLVLLALVSGAQALTDCPPFQQCGASQCCSLAQYCSTEDGPAHCVDIPHFAGIGDCQPPQIQNNDDALLAVTCNGPLHTMMPGEASAPDQTVLLGNPYPSNATVVVESMTSQMVDAANNPVLLSELYVHHYVANIHFLLGEGAEIRGSALRRPLPLPYAYVIQGNLTSNPMLRYTNIQLINTAGVPQHAMQQCLECWCQEGLSKGQGGASGNTANVTATMTTGLLDQSAQGQGKKEPVHGSLMCCTQCPSTLEGSTPRQYSLQHNVTYRVLNQTEKGMVKPVSTLGFDLTGGDIEYDILAPNAPNNTHTLVRHVVVDYRCPQSAPFTLLRCSGHQHIGGGCIEVADANSGHVLCRSCPKMGTEKDVPGNEAGYVVAMLDDDLWTGNRTPPVLQPGTLLRMTSTYDASQRRLGVMALITMWFGDLEGGCPSGFDFDDDHDAYDYGGDVRGDGANAGVQDRTQQRGHHSMKQIMHDLASDVTMA